MPDPTSEIDAYIDRGFYYEKLRSLRTLYMPEDLVGHRNPYTGKIIRTLDEADSYLQQQALSSAYRQAADMAISSIRSESSSKIAVLGSRVTELEHKLSRSRTILVILGLVLLSFFTLLPVLSEEEESSSPEKAYVSSQEAPAQSYAYSGSSSSSSSGRSSSSSSNSSSGSSSSGDTLLDAYLRRQGESQETAYKTTPIAGYSLDMTVYVSISGGKIHRRSNCSGMKNYNTMTYGEACEKGYVHCKKCF